MNPQDLNEASHSEESPILTENVCRGMWTRPIRGQNRTVQKAGLEMEMFAYDAKTWAPLGTEGSAFAPSVLLERIHRLSPGSHLKIDEETAVLVGVALENGGNFSLEPGGQVEYSSSPKGTLQELGDDVTLGLQLLEEAADGQVLFASHGTNPVGYKDFPLVVPKSRYQIMTRYFNSEPGGRGVHMMRQTATVQPNLDVSGDDATWSDAVSLCYVLTPFARHIFSNSAFFHNSKVESFSERQMIWTKMDSTRSGIPTGLVGEKDVVCPYIRWALQANVFLVEGLPIAEQPLFGELKFANWLKSGYKGVFPRLKDWETHLATLFPELRLRSFLEIRSTDAQDFSHTFAPAAFWSGLLQNEKARIRVWDFLLGLSKSKVHFEIEKEHLSADLSKESRHFNELIQLPIAHPLFRDQEIHRVLFRIAADSLKEQGQDEVGVRALSAFQHDRERQIQLQNVTDGKTFLQRIAVKNPSQAFVSNIQSKSARKWKS
jgi:glutamate--cysteine ligase